MAFFTAATMTSPTEAYLLEVPPNTFIHITFLAPLLSATSSLVNSIIILSGLPQDAYQSPAFSLAYGPGLRYFYLVPYLGLLFLIVGLIDGNSLHILPINRMFYQLLHLNEIGRA